MPSGELPLRISDLDHVRCRRCRRRALAIVVMSVALAFVAIWVEAWQ